MKSGPTWLAFLFAVVAAGYCVLLERKLDTNDKLLDRLSAEIGKTESSNSFNNLEIQKRCSEQARQIYKDGGYSLSGATDSSMESYVNHFSKIKNICFIKISYTDTKRAFVNEQLLDAFENTDFGTFTQQIGSNDFKVLECYVGKPKATECSSQAEFDDLAESYMKGD